MNYKLSFIVLIGIPLVLSGCAGMSSEECMATDWSAIGYEDGSRGYTTDRFATHRKACAKHGVTADFSDYKDGRAEGLREYCQPSRGFNVGVNGGSYYGVCGVDQEDDFLDAYNTGHHLYSLRSAVNHANSSINSKKYEIERNENQIISHGADIVAIETTQERRIFLLAEIKRLSERNGELEAEIEELYHVRAQAQADLDHFQLVVADMGY